MASNLVLSFTVEKGGSTVRTAEFTEESVTIGKGANALLSIDDPALADLHAVVNVEDDGTVQLLDLGSQMGTKVNGEAISNKVLRSGDVLEFGDVRVSLMIADDEAYDDEEATNVGAPPAAYQAAAAAAEAAAAEDAVEEDDEPPTNEEPRLVTEEQFEDVMEFIMRFGTAQSKPRDRQEEGQGARGHPGLGEPPPRHKALRTRQEARQHRRRGRVQVEPSWRRAGLDSEPHGEHPSLLPSHVVRSQLRLAR